jgi:hypothetical protein
MGWRMAKDVPVHGAENRGNGIHSRDSSKLEGNHEVLKSDIEISTPAILQNVGPHALAPNTHSVVNIMKRSREVSE